MASKIQLRRGLKTNLPTLSAGEAGYCTDTEELFIGTGSGNVNMGGSQWYTGTAMSGTSSTTGAYSYSGADAKVGDMYLNTTYGYIYQCTTAGSGTAAKWTYKGSIKGAKGDPGSEGSYFPSNGYISMDEVTLELSDFVAEHVAPPTTITIGTPESKHQWAVDYNCSGNNDTAQIQAAINALPTGGGKIVFLEGEYNITSKLTCDKNVVFEGMGDGTILNCTSHAFLYNTTTGLRITVRDMAFNLSGTLTDSAPFIYAKSDITLDNCSVTSTASAIEENVDFICGHANVTATKCKFSVVLTSASGDCGGFFAAQQSGYRLNISDCYIYMSNQSTAANVYFMRGLGGSLSNSYIKLVGKSSSVKMYLDEYGTDISNCEIDVTNSYADINRSDRPQSEAYRFRGNKVTYANGLYIMHRHISDNYFKGSGYVRLYSAYGVTATGNTFVNSAANTILGQSYTIFKNNLLKYSCTVSSATTSTVADNIVYSSLTW